MEALRLPKKDEMELVSNLPPINRPLRLKIHRRPSEIEPLIASNNFLMPKQLLHPKIPTSIVPVDLIGIFNSFTMIISDANSSFIKYYSVPFEVLSHPQEDIG